MQARHPVVTRDLEQIIGAQVPWERLRGKTILISGASGVLPAYMVETLLFLNERISGFNVRVLGLVRNHGRATARFAAYSGREDLSLVVGDVSQALPPGLGADIVIHAASQASPIYYDTDPVGTLAANVLGTHHLLELSRVSGAEAFLYFSSGEVYGEVDAANVPTTESDYGYLDPTRVRSCYGESKRLGETMCVAYHHQHGVPATIARPYHTYGPGIRLADGRVFADFVGDIVARRPLVMKSDGSATRAFCYLSDATVAFFQVLLAGESGVSYNVGNDEAELSILALAQVLGDEFGLDVVEQARETAGEYVPSTITRSAPDVTRLRRLGWKPTVPVREGFRRTIATFATT